MKTKRIRFLCILLLCLLTAQLLCACSKTQPNETSSPASESSLADAESQTPSDPTSEAPSDAESDATSDVESDTTSDADSDTTSRPIIPPQTGVSMSYEIPDRFEDAYTDAFGVTDLQEMTVNSTANAYTITYTDADGGIFLVKLVKKRWGVWMLGDISYTAPDKQYARIMDAATDYEWVMKCGKSASSITFRGGNHGDFANGQWNEEDSSKSNDRLLDITLYDASTGEKLPLKTGNKTTVHGLRVVLHNNVYDGEYNEDNVLLCVEKIYLFNGYDVFVQSNIRVVQDTYFKTSYTCMMPIYKKYGNNALFYNDDGSQKLVRTPLQGTSNYGSNFSDNNVSSRVEMWGDESPAYHMTMQIYNPEDQFKDSALHTRLWDMNPATNKLYFSAFSEATATLVPKGTTWDYRSSWSFSYQPDFVNPENADELLGF